MRNLGEQPALIFQMKAMCLAVGYHSSIRRQQEEILKTERLRERVCVDLT